MSDLISNQASVHSSAKIAGDVKIHPFACVGPKVTLHAGVEICSGAVITGDTIIGEGTKVYSFATVGSEPQDLKYKGEPARLEIGKNNSIREYANISIGTEHGGMLTKIGDQNLFMIYTHVAHDCQIQNNCVIANSVQLAGHVEMDDNVVIGGVTGVHQFVRIGKHAMIGAGSMVALDVTPFTTVFGNRAKPTGLNLLGMRRSGYSREQIGSVKKMYQYVYQSKLTLEVALEKIADEFGDDKLALDYINFIKSSTRGLSR